MRVVNNPSIRPSSWGFRWHLWGVGPLRFPWKKRPSLPGLFLTPSTTSFKVFPRTSCSNQLIRCEISMILESFPSSFCIITWEKVASERLKTPQIYYGSPQTSALTKGDSLYITFQDHHFQPLRGISFPFPAVFMEEFLLGRSSERVSIEQAVIEVCEGASWLGGVCWRIHPIQNQCTWQVFVTFLIKSLSDLQLGAWKRHIETPGIFHQSFFGHSTKMWSMFFLFWWVFGKFGIRFKGYVGKIIDSITKHELTNLDAPHAL